MIKNLTLDWSSFSSIKALLWQAPSCLGIGWDQILWMLFSNKKELWLLSIWKWHNMKMRQWGLVVTEMVGRWPQEVDFERWEITWIHEEDMHGCKFLPPEENLSKWNPSSPSNFSQMEPLKTGGCGWMKSALGTFNFSVRLSYMTVGL